MQDGQWWNAAKQNNLSNIQLFPECVAFRHIRNIKLPERLDLYCLNPHIVKKGCQKSSPTFSKCDNFQLKKENMGTKWQYNWIDR